MKTISKLETCSNNVRCIKLLPKNIVEESSPWKAQHNWPQTGNVMTKMYAALSMCTVYMFKKDDLLEKDD